METPTNFGSENVGTSGSQPLSVSQICHKKHHRWLARRLAYVGLGNYKEVSFEVWTHSTSREDAENDTICRRTRQGFIPVGTFEECLLDPVRRIQRRPQRKMSDIWYPSIR